jgi:hypothetical protein
MCKIEDMPHRVVFRGEIQYAFSVSMVESCLVDRNSQFTLPVVSGPSLSSRDRGIWLFQDATMMTPAAFQQWGRALALPSAPCDLLAPIRTPQPVRRVTSRVNNMSGTYPSDKMGVTIPFESHKVELWAILVMDRDPDVLEFYDQPHPFKLRYLRTSGKQLQSHSFVRSERAACSQYHALVGWACLHPPESRRHHDHSIVRERETDPDPLWLLLSVARYWDNHQTACRRKRTRLAGSGPPHRRSLPRRSAPGQRAL